MACRLLAVCWFSINKLQWIFTRPLKIDKKHMRNMIELERIFLFYEKLRDIKGFRHYEPRFSKELISMKGCSKFWQCVRIPHENLAGLIC